MSDLMHAKTTAAPPAKDDAPNLDVLFDAITSADTGDGAALERLRAVFRAMPDVVQQVSDLAYNAEAAILANVPPGVQEVFRRQTRELRKNLQAEGSGTALERMLIRRIALDYVASLQAERTRALAPGESRSLELSRFYDQQTDRAHRRFLASVESLARIRKLITPIQINIADQQVNVAGDVRSGTVPRERWDIDPCAGAPSR